ncbi:DUF4304 domain-containing protein [Niabella hirudinis]|uniref:DUF4304 domain-containing protein n=1 Tax=Niabella hirudinis TaxID=1285929 RepID=UPI003EBA25D9
MEGNIIEFILDRELIPQGFKKKGKKWFKEEQELIKKVFLQKAFYGNQFYINYGYIIKNIGAEKWFHIVNRLGSKNGDRNEEAFIKNLLDLDHTMNNDDRTIYLSKYIQDQVVREMNDVENEEGVLNNLKNRKHLFDVPLIVKQFFNLPMD